MGACHEPTSGVLLSLFRQSWRSFGRLLSFVFYSFRLFAFMAFRVFSLGFLFLGESKCRRQQRSRLHNSSWSGSPRGLEPLVNFVVGRRAGTQVHSPEYREIGNGSFSGGKRDKITRAKRMTLHWMLAFNIREICNHLCDGYFDVRE